GALRTYEGFIDRYVGSRDRRVPANVPELRDRLRDVMIRHRRGIAFTLPPRRVHSLPVRLSPAERRLYDDVTDFVRDAYWSASGRMSWAARLVEFLRSSDEKALVFTQYLRTLQQLQRVLAGEVLHVAPYTG